MTGNGEPLPEPWANWVQRKGRPPSYRGLRDATGLNTTTLHNIVKGKNTSDAKIEAIARTLGVSPAEVYAARGRPVPNQPWQPDEGKWLEPHERDLLTQLVRIITAGRDKARGDTGA